MSGPADGQRLHLGFLKVVTIDKAFVGGLLVTNRQGRPLEFQCTTPVRPNRTQEILYGSTLGSFLYSELIGRTLVERLAVKPDMVIVEQPEILELRQHVDLPVACIVSGTVNENAATSTRVQLGRQFVEFHPEHPADPTLFGKRLSLVASDCDLIEPLERVEEALRETMRAGAVA